MSLHPLVAGFADVADLYERGRPGYPPEVVAGLGLPAGARVADVGAGTGKLTRALVAAGYDVVAVEPLAGLRERLLAEVSGAEVLDAPAEALPLPAGSLDAVVCADAFHWFDGPRAVAEFARVLRRGGTLTVLWNIEDEEATPWQRELAALLASVRPEHPSFTDDQGRGAIAASPAFGPLQLTAIERPHPTDPERLLAQIASISYVAGLPEPDRADVLGRAAAILRRHGVGAVAVPLRATIWTARRR